MIGERSEVGRRERKYGRVKNGVDVIEIMLN